MELHISQFEPLISFHSLHISCLLSTTTYVCCQLCLYCYIQVMILIWSTCNGSLHKEKFDLTFLIPFLKKKTLWSILWTWIFLIHKSHEFSKRNSRYWKFEWSFFKNPFNFYDIQVARFILLIVTTDICFKHAEALCLMVLSYFISELYKLVQWYAIDAFFLLMLFFT